MIDLGAKLILDPKKATVEPTFEHVPDIPVPVAVPVLDKDGKPILDKDGKAETTIEYKRNTELGKDNGIWLVLRYLTAAQRQNMNFRMDVGEEGITVMPMVSTFKKCVVEVHGVTYQGVNCDADTILNAVGSDLAEALIASVYHAVTKNGELNKDERKN